MVSRAHPKTEEHPSEGKVVVVQNVTKHFLERAAAPVRALQGVSFEVKPTEYIVVYGPSGCGKSTLLHVMSGLEPPTEGKVWIQGKDLFRMTEDERSEFRARHIGILYQQPMWVRSLNILDNTALPLTALGEYETVAKRKARHIIYELGLQRLMRRLPVELSGGEQQLMGLVRALVSDPWLLLLDEPTGNLDTHSADRLMKTVYDLNKKKKRTIILVTHNLIYLHFADRAIAMEDGLISKKISPWEKVMPTKMAERLKELEKTHPLGRDRVKVPT